MSDFILQKYMDDLSDADLVLVPIEGMNRLQFARPSDRGRARMFNRRSINPGLCRPPCPGVSRKAIDLKNPQEMTDVALCQQGKYMSFRGAQRAATEKGSSTRSLTPNLKTHAAANSLLFSDGWVDS